LAIFRKNRYYIKLFVNQIEIKDLINGKTIAEKSLTEFNNQRLLIADFGIAEKFVKGTFNKFGFSTRNAIGIIQQMEMTEGGLSEVEKRVLLELFTVVGLSQVHIVEGILNLSEKQLSEY